MKTILLSLLLLLANATAWGQMRYLFASTPDSATVSLNGSAVATTPCDVRRFWKGEPLEFSVSKPGYKPFQFTVTEKPLDFYTRVVADLARDYPFKVDSNSAIVAIDKVVLGFPSTAVLGQREEYGLKRDILWEGSVKVGERTFASKAAESLTDAGFKVAAEPDEDSYVGAERRRQLPRFVLSAKIKEVKLDIYIDDKAKWDRDHVSKVRIEVEWQVTDKALKKVVHTGTTTGSYTRRASVSYQNSVTLTAYEFALFDFLKDGTFARLVNEAGKSDAPRLVEETPAELLTLPAIPAKAFDSPAQMIQAATSACATVSTDAGHGSAVIIGAEGHLLTAYHVIDGVNRIEVILSNDVKMQAEVLAFDAEYDVALLKIPGSGYKALPIADSQKSGLGTEVFTIGTPSEVELGQSVSKGIVSGRRKIEEVVVIQTDVAVSPGNSGGPLLNSDGAIIGIIQRKLIGKGIEGIGFALPIETVLQRLGVRIQ